MLRCFPAASLLAAPAAPSHAAATLLCAPRPIHRANALLPPLLRCLRVDLGPTLRPTSPADESSSPFVATAVAPSSGGQRARLVAIPTSTSRQPPKAASWPRPPAARHPSAPPSVRSPSAASTGRQTASARLRSSPSAPRSTCRRPARATSCSSSRCFTSSCRPARRVLWRELRCVGACCGVTVGDGVAPPLSVPPAALALAAVHVAGLHHRVRARAARVHVACPLRRQGRRRVVGAIVSHAAPSSRRASPPHASSRGPTPTPTSVSPSASWTHSTPTTSRSRRARVARSARAGRAWPRTRA